MKELINTIWENFKKEGFTKREVIKYGIVYPLAFLILYAIVGTLEYHGF